MLIAVSRATAAVNTDPLAAAGTWRSESNNATSTGADQPECTTYQCPLTVKHILVDCSDFNDTHNKHFVASSMEELFITTDVHSILDFTKETHFYSK